MIESLKTGTILYHGSYCEVRQPDLQKCKQYKDFGQGFYLTKDLEQAKNFAKLSTKKAYENGQIKFNQNYGIVSCFQYEATESLRIKIFEEANVEWLHCVVGHRKDNIFLPIVSDMKQYDIIGGKIANDATNATILTYISEVFGKIGTVQADTICINLLLPNRLQDQYCFKTDKAIQQLRFLKSLKYEYRHK